MDKRLQQFLDAENISQAQLADTLGVARAGISHILSGRALSADQHGLAPDRQRTDV